MNKILLMVVALAYSIFADTIYMKNGNNVENATLTKITQTDIEYRVGERDVIYTISKDDVAKVKYNDDSEDVFVVMEQPLVPSISLTDDSTKQESNEQVRWGVFMYDIGFLGLSLALGDKFGDQELFTYGFGYWLEAHFPEIDDVIPLENMFFFLLRYDFLNWNDRKIFLGSKFGIGTNVAINPFIGILFNKWNFALGYSGYADKTGHITLKIGSDLELTHTKAETEKIEKSAEEFRKREANRERFFRCGIELNSPIWRDIKYFDNSFPYTALGGGLFFRIGPEKILYLTTGLYFKYEEFERQLTVGDFASIFGLSIPSIIDKPLLDLKWEKKSLEIPLLLNFGSEQIKFSGGMLFELIDGNEYFINEINEKFMENSTGNVYWILGLDFDITRSWGIGIKFLTWNTSLDKDKPLIEPGSQARISTYFVL